MQGVRYLLTAALAAALVAAGCSGAEPAASADAAPAPADTAVYVTVDTDRESVQWQQVEELLKRIPGAEQAVEDGLGEALGKAGLEWDGDVAPALGPTVALVLPGKSSDPVLLTQPEDEAKLDALLAKSDENPVAREIDGWTAVAEDEAALDAYERALSGEQLSGQAAFAEAMAELPEDALARVYVRGDALDLAGLSQSIAGLGGGGLASPGTLGLGTLAAAVVAEDEGMRVVGSAQQESLPRSFTPTLLANVPDDALLAATFEGGKQLTEQLRTALVGSGPLLEGLERQLGVSLEEVVSLLEGQGVVYLRPGIPIPEVTLVLEQTDARQPATLKTLLQALAAASKGQLATATEDGVQVTRLTLGPVSVASAATNGNLFVTTGRGGIAAFLADNAKLVDDAGFRGAMDRVGYDGSTSGLVYADVDALVPLLEGLAGLAGGTTSGLDEVTKALAAVDSFALNTATSGDTAELEGFLAVR